MPGAFGILAPQPGMEPVLPAVEAQSPNHWTAREFPIDQILTQLPVWALETLKHLSSFTLRRIPSEFINILICYG